MNGKELCGKIAAAVSGAWLGSRMGLLFPALGLLTILMVADYASGMVAARKEALEHPDSKEYGWSSKKGILGIFKKVGYAFTILVAVCVDDLICQFARQMGISDDSQTYFGLLSAIWFILNESISILENAGRMGVELPEFLKKTLSELKKDMDKKAEK